MARPNYAEIVGAVKKHGVAVAKPVLRAWFQEGVCKPEDFDLANVFIECFGWNEFSACKSLGYDRPVSSVMEAAGAVSTSAFRLITSQLAFTATMEGYENEEFVFSSMIPDVQSEIIGTEKIPGITSLGDAALVVDETKPYPIAGVSEDYIEAPEVQKRGLIVPLTREMVFAARSSAPTLIQRCRAAGDSLGLRKEKRNIDCLIDENEGATSAATGHRYKWRGTVIATYGDNSGSHTWDNLAAQNTLVDWTDIDNAEQVFNGMVDPSTGEPIRITPEALICTKQLEMTALRIVNATEIAVATPGWATTGNPTETRVGNPMSGRFRVVSSRLLAARLGTDTTWFYGQPSKAFRYKVIFPMQVIEAPTNSHDEFHRDIVQQFRADEAGAPYTVDPRYMVKSTVA